MLSSSRRSVRGRPGGGSGPSPANMMDVEAILATNVSMKRIDDEALGDACRRLLGKEGRMADADHSREVTRWGNPRGLTTLERLDDLDKRNADLDTRMAEMDKRNAAMDERNVDLIATVGTLQDELRAMKLSSSAYLEVRNRFISTFKRDKLQNANKQDLATIRRSNIGIHSGDALLDAVAYQKRLRRDTETYEELYGMPWSTVLNDYGNPSSLLDRVREQFSVLN